jgi:dihydrofolate reductase
MRVAIIAAMDRRGLIGDAGGLPWHLPRDLRRFRTLTWGKPVIMGRRTFESIGKPLPGRLNIILTQQPGYQVPGGRVARTLEEALAVAEGYLAATGGDEVMVIGGGQIYAAAMHCWERCYLTVVEGQFQGSTYFPLGELLRQPWRPAREPEMHPADEKNRHRHSFHIIERVRDTPLAASSNPTPASAQADLDLVTILERGTVPS